jgi:hypothetical protein
MSFIYAALDDWLCLMSCLGYTPSWYREWYAR